MNTLTDIINKYDITKELLSNILNISVYSFDRYKKKTVNMLTLEQICILRSHLNITFNELLGEQVFTPDNIDNQTDNTKHTSLSDNLVIIEENEIHLHPKFAEAIRKAIQDNKEYYTRTLYRQKNQYK